MKDFAEAILAEDPTQRRYWEYEDKPFAELIDAKYQARVPFAARLSMTLGVRLISSQMPTVGTTSKSGRISRLNLS